MSQPDYTDEIRKMRDRLNDIAVVLKGKDRGYALIASGHVQVLLAGLEDTVDYQKVVHALTEHNIPIPRRMIEAAGGLCLTKG